MKDLKNRLVSDEDLTKVDGGKLPLGWQAVISGGIKSFKETPEAEIQAMGYTKDADGLIKYLLGSGYAEQFNLTENDIATVRQYIINHY